MKTIKFILGMLLLPLLFTALSLIHISEPTRQAEISYAVFCLKKKKEHKQLINYGIDKRRKNQINLQKKSFYTITKK